MERKAYCTSLKCTGKVPSAPAVGVVKQVSSRTTECPDCLHVLVWRVLNERGIAKYRSIPKHKENR